MKTGDEIRDLLECIAKFDSTESLEIKGRYFEQIQTTAQQLVNKNLDLLSVVLPKGTLCACGLTADGTLYGKPMCEGCLHRNT